MHASMRIFAWFVLLRFGVPICVSLFVFVFVCSRAHACMFVRMFMTLFTFVSVSVYMRDVVKGSLDRFLL